MNDADRVAPPRPTASSDPPEAAANRPAEPHTATAAPTLRAATQLAHDLGQPLTAVLNYAEGLERRSRQDAPLDPLVLARALQQIVEQGTRAATLLSTLRATLGGLEGVETQPAGRGSAPR